MSERVMRERTSSLNIAELVIKKAAEKPDAAVLQINGQQYTYKNLVVQIDYWRCLIEKTHLKPNTRVLILHPIAFDLFAGILALLMQAHVAVMVDLGMTTRKIVQALWSVRPRAVITTPQIAKRFSWIFYWLGMKVICVSEDQRVPPSVSVFQFAFGDEALITFSSGSTGKPKGANRTHALLHAQHKALLEEFPFEENDVDMPCFPVVVLHNLCAGIPTILPQIDFRRVAEYDPSLIVAQIHANKVTRLSAAPAFMERLCAYLQAQDLKLESVTQVAVGGAAVSRRLCKDLVASFPRAQVQVIYGSTEAEPIAHVSACEVIGFAGLGCLVGRAARAAQIKLLSLETGKEITRGEVGELIVSGNHVNRAYIKNEKAMRENKIIDAEGILWHRTGDTAYQDEEGRYVIVGRVADTIWRYQKAYHPYPLEEKIEGIEGVKRAALIAHRKALTGEFVVSFSQKPCRLQCLREILDADGLFDVPIAVVENLPVDGRHMSKIDRPLLRTMREHAR